MPSPATGADRTKVLSVRLSIEEFEALKARATEIGVGPSTLARTFVRQAMAGSPASTSSALPSTRHPAHDSALEAHVEALIAADLAARVEALERWVADHDVSGGSHGTSAP